MVIKNKDRHDTLGHFKRRNIGFSITYSRIYSIMKNKSRPRSKSVKNLLLRARELRIDGKFVTSEARPVKPRAHC